MGISGVVGNRTGRLAVGVAVAGAVGLGLLALPPAAGAAPALPPVTPQALMTSVLAAGQPGPFAGTVTLDNDLGLPALPDLPQAADGTSTARIWSAGDGKGRVQIPTATAERTIVADGTTVWSWNSADRTVTRSPEKDGAVQPQHSAVDPTKAASQALAALAPTSTISVDGTAEVAGRPAYELVLAPKPTERTLLREVRIAVDAAERVPLQLTVLAQGSADPVLQIGFSALTFGAQDPALFAYTPPAGATVTDDGAPQAHGRPAGATAPKVVGSGWDAVVVEKLPTAAARPDGNGNGPGDGPPAAQLATLGTPVSGSWGSGRLISTSVATAIITGDGRIAVGAVPEQVLTAALS